MGSKTANPSSNIDDQLVAILEPLVGSGAKLYYPFFANTFPLAYHYYLAIQGQDSKVDEGDDERIVQVPWTKSIGEISNQSPAKVCVFYATKSDVLQNGLSGHPVCVYQPKSIFFDRTPSALDVAETFGSEFAGDQVFSALMSARKHVDVHSDIPLQAKSILGAFTHEDKKKKWRFWYPNLNFRHALTSPPNLNALRVYLYGGPLTAFLRRQTREYVEFRLPDTLIKSEVPEAFNTYVCTNSTDPVLIDALARYHDALFAAAREGDYNGFWAVRNAYNRIAKTLQHPSSFKSAPEYAECLRDHYDSPVPISLPQTKSHQPQRIGVSGKPLVLLGCGELALGLVLPCLDPDIPLSIVVVRRKEGEWKYWQPISLKLKETVTLSNELGYEREFTISNKTETLARSTWSPGESVLTMVDKWDDAVAIAGQAEWVAASLRGGLSEAFKALSKSPSRNPKPPLLLFENRVPDVGEVSKVFETAHVICDRICTTRYPSMDCERVIGLCEGYGEIIVHEKYARLFNPTSTFARFSHSVSDFGEPVDMRGKTVGQEHLLIRLVDDADALDLYKYRKSWLMNSVQYVLALVAAAGCMERGIKLGEMPVFLAEPILDKIDPRLRPCVEVFIECQIARIMTTPKTGTDLSLIQSVLGGCDFLCLYENLRRYVEMNRERCAYVTDFASRLINEQKSDYFKQYLLEPYCYYYHLDGFARMRNANLSCFRFSPKDVELAFKTLVKTEGDVTNWLRKSSFPGASSI
jgi:hypothetical protein